MGTFSKIKKYSKPSHEIEEKIECLDKELKKTLGEAITNSTAGVYSVTQYTEPVSAVPPTISNVPDTSGVTGGSFTQNNITNDNTGYTDISQLFNTNIGDSPTPIIQTPLLTPSGGVGLAWHSVTLNGDAVGYIGPGNKFQQVLNPSIAGGTDTSYDGAGYFGPNYYINLELRRSFAIAYESAPHAAYNLQAGTYITWQCWLPYNPYGFGALYNDYSGIKKTDDEGNWGLANIIIGIRPNTYQSDPGSPYQHGYTTLISRNGLGDPNYYPGTILNMLNKSRLSKEAFRSLVAGYSLKPDGTIGPPSKLGDKIRGSDGKMYELVPRPGYGYNQWVPVKQAGAGSGDDQIASHDKPFSKYPPAGGPDGWPGLPPNKLDLLNTPPNPTKPGDPPILPFGLPQAQGGNQDTQVAWNTPVLPTGPSTPIRNYGTKDKPMYMPYEPGGFPGNYAPGYQPVGPKQAKKNKERDMIASFELEGELISESRQKILPEKLQHIDFDEIADLEKFEKALSASQLIMLEKNLLKYIEENPEQIEALRKRYPISDPRLSELNYKLDKMVGASDEYLEIQFQQNQKLFKKLQKSIKRNIKLTDPKTFKNVVDTPSFKKLLSVDYVNEIGAPKKKLKLQNRNKKTAARFLKKPRIKTAYELIQQKIIDLDNNMKKVSIYT